MRSISKVVGALLAIGCLPVIAQNTVRDKKVYYYSSAQVKTAAAKNPNGKQHSTNGELGELLNLKDIPMLKNAPKYKVTVRRKEGPQEPEFHKDKTHIFYVLEGTATLITGGKVPRPGNGRYVGENDTEHFDGQTVEGGETWKLEPGSIVVIPAGVIHWFKDVPSKPWVAFNVELFE
jgi:quercetin dioxygenase-like cupin family protein